MKIMIISTVGLTYEGITSFILNTIKAMDCAGLDIYIAGTIRVEESIRKQFGNLDCKIIDFPDRKKDTIRYFIELVSYIRQNQIEVVHANGNSATLAIEMLAAWIGRCKCRIAHSHNTRCNQQYTDRLLRPLFYRLYTVALACGEDAGRWMFGNHPFTVLNNGRDLEKYKYNPVMREEMRKRFDIGNVAVFGHVGGFVPQKNHEYLIKICAEIIKLIPEARFFLVGDGPLRNEIERKTEELGIKESIYFTGNIDNIDEYLQIFDVMLFPSLYEGLPLVVLEGQLAGLNCLISDSISDECLISDNVKLFGLNKTPFEWAQLAIKLIENDGRAEHSVLAASEAKKKGFDIIDSSAKLRSIYTFG